MASRGEQDPGAALVPSTVVRLAGAWPAILAAVLTALCVFAASDAHAQGRGEWVRADGARVYMDCPGAHEYGARTRLPASCRAAHPGILYTLARDAQCEAAAAQATQCCAQADEIRRILGTDRAALDRLKRELAGLAAEHETIAAQLRAAEAQAAQADADRRDAEARARGFRWGDAAIGAGVGGVVVGGAVLALLVAL